MFQNLMKSMLALCACLLAGCSAPDVEVLEPVNVEAVAETQTQTVEDIAVKAPLNCPAMITAKSDYSKRDDQKYLFFSISHNPDFDIDLGDACRGDVKNLWHDFLRFEAEIESHLPNVKGWFNATIIFKNFPKTESELKHFIDQASKNQGLPHQLDNIDRSTLEGGLEYQNKILGLIIEQERIYWQAVHTPVMDTTLSKYGTVHLKVGSEKHAYCYHPHETCRGYYRYDDRKEERPESHIGVKSEFDLEYLWAGIGSYGFDLIEFKNSEN